MKIETEIKKIFLVVGIVLSFYFLVFTRVIKAEERRVFIIFDYNICQELIEEDSKWLAFSVYEDGNKRNLITGPTEYSYNDEDVQNSNCPTFKPGTTELPFIPAVEISEGVTELSIEAYIETGDGEFYTIHPDHSVYSVPISTDPDNPPSLWWGGGLAEGDPTNSIRLVKSTEEGTPITDTPFLSIEYGVSGTDPLSVAVPVSSIPIKWRVSDLQLPCEMKVWFNEENNVIDTQTISTESQSEERNYSAAAFISNDEDDIVADIGATVSCSNGTISERTRVLLDNSFTEEELEELNTEVYIFKSFEFDEFNVSFEVGDAQGSIVESLSEVETCENVYSCSPYGNDSSMILYRGGGHFLSATVSDGSSTLYTLINEEFDFKGGKVFLYLYKDEIEDKLKIMDITGVVGVVRSNGGINACAGGMGCVNCVARYVDRGSVDDPVTMDNLKTFKEEGYSDYNAVSNLFISEPHKIVYTNNVYTALGCWDTSQDGTIVRLMQLGIGISGGLILMRAAQGLAKLGNAKEPEGYKDAMEMIWGAVLALIMILFGAVGLRFLGVNVFRVLPPGTIEIVDA